MLFVCNALQVPRLSSTCSEHRIALAPFANGQATSLAAHLLQLCSGADLIVFNLFALEGYSLAEKLGIPSVAVSPFLLGRPPPARFEEEFAAIYPTLFSDLHTAKEEEGWVTWGHVDNWMWRLFLDDVGAFREALGLPAAPFLDERGASKLLHATASADDSDAPAAGDPPATVSVALPVLPPPLLVMVSSTLIPREPYWPQNVVLAGRWSLDATMQSLPSVATQAALAGILNNGDRMGCCDDNGDEPPGSAAVAAAAAASGGGGKCSKSFIYVGFGSMDTLKGLLSVEQSEHLARAVVGAVRELIETPNSHFSASDASKSAQTTASIPPPCFLFQTSKGSEYDSALRTLLAALDLAVSSKVCLLSEHVSHDWLFQLEQCVAVVSHGGAGTVHSAVAAGTRAASSTPNCFCKPFLQPTPPRLILLKGLCGPTNHFANDNNTPLALLKHMPATLTTTNNNKKRRTANYLPVSI